MNDDNPRSERQGAFGGQAWNVPPPGAEEGPDDQRTAPMQDQGTAPTEPLDQKPRRLERSSDDRVLAGVAGGLGRYFGVDPVIFRIGFPISLFFGGLGGLAYLLLAVFVPTDGEPDRAQKVGGRAQRFGARLREMGFWRGLGLVLIAALLLCGLVMLAGGAAAAVALGWGVPVAIVVIVIGGLLLLAAFRGGARWLIPPAVALAVGASVAAASDLDFQGGIGDREYRPLSAASIPSDGYELGIGRLVVDLREIDWRKDEVVRVKLRLGAGQANVFVPENVCVSGSAHLRAGESQVAGELSDGWDVDQDIEVGAGVTPRLDLDADVDFGQLRVINSDTATVDDRRSHTRFYNEDAEPLRAAQARACAA
jgi:phage shock protein PspC (stress-responsive transcriptional regulator)